MEADVQKAIIQYLLLHPRVRMVERINSGAMKGEHKGTKYYVRFIQIYLPLKYSKKMRPCDLHVTLNDGRRMCIEVKKPGWTKPKDEREREQANYLEHVRECGGLGIFATSIDEVREALR